MSKVIRITDEVYERLEKLAKGFDTPSKIIGTLLDKNEEKLPGTAVLGGKDVNDGAPQPPPPLLITKPEIRYFPSPEGRFKQKLLTNKKAYLKIFFLDGQTQTKEWTISRFSDESSVKQNLFSGYLRGWREKKIWRIDVAIDQEDLT